MRAESSSKPGFLNLAPGKKNESMEEIVEGNQLIPVSLDEIPEPDEADIDLNILSKKEQDFKYMIWAEQNKDWIASDRAKKQQRKAEKKRNKLLSA